MVTGRVCEAKKGNTSAGSSTHFFLCSKSVQCANNGVQGLLIYVEVREKSREKPCEWQTLPI